MYGHEFFEMGEIEMTASQNPEFSDLCPSSSSADLAALRVIDANANRAAEGLRTLEDYARLVKEDGWVSEQLKILRHSLASALAEVPRTTRLGARNTETDAGTSNSTPSEMLRSNLAEIIPAAAERVTQSLRCLEEFGKVLSAQFSRSIKQIRYEAYDILASAELRLACSRQPLVDARLYLLIDCSRPEPEFVKYVEELATAGVDLFQLRDKHADGQTLMRYARLAVQTLASTNAKLIVNDRIDIALASGAAGAHLGQEDISLTDARRIAGSLLWLGISTHNLEQAVAAEQGGADYVGCGPTFPSTTKAFDAFAGTRFLSEAAKSIQLPTFAIGGINAHNLHQVQEAGVHRIAVCGVIHNAADPIVSASNLSEALRIQAPEPSRTAS